MKFDLDYCPKITNIDLFHVDSPAYERRFSYLVNDPKLAPFGAGEVYSPDEYDRLLHTSGAALWPKKNKTCVARVPVEVVEGELKDPQSNFSKLVSAIKLSKAYTNGKLFFNPFNHLHFTYHFKDFSDSLDTDKMNRALKGRNSYRVRFQGLTFFERSIGRIFFCVCPEMDDSGNGDIKIRQSLARFADGLIFNAASGFVNLKRNLDDEEKQEIRDIMNRFGNLPLLEFSVEKIEVLWVADDLMIKTWNIQTIELEK